MTGETPERLPWAAILRVLDAFEGAGFSMSDADASGRAAELINQAALSYAGRLPAEPVPLRIAMLRELASTWEQWAAEGHEDGAELHRRLDLVLRRQNHGE